MKIFIYLMVFLLFFGICDAAIYKQEFNIEEDNAEVNIEIIYDNKNDFSFYLGLPKDVKEIKVYLDDEEKKFSVREAELNNFAYIFGKAKNIKINYNSKDYIEHSSKYYFTAEINPVVNGNMEIKVILPEGATLDKLYDKKTSGSIYPNPSKLESNGKNIIITWEKEGLAYEIFSLFFVYNKSSFNFYILIILFFILIILYSSYYLIKKRKSKRKKVKTNSLDKHLKEDEKLIINILRKKKGKCTQATLLTLSNMSKASLSRLLMELEQRNIIKKEQKGNKNLIILKGI